VVHPSPVYFLLKQTDLPCRLKTVKAAVVLSASVTFLSLPGFDAFSRTTGMVAILFAAFSMAATVVEIKPTWNAQYRI
jgi:hypothetical protein